MPEVLHQMIKVFQHTIQSKTKQIFILLDSDRKSTDLSAKSESIHPSSRIHIDYPGKKDPNVIRDVEKCLAFYEKIREYFDDDAAAMLLKCCLCYGDCSGKK